MHGPLGSRGSARVTGHLLRSQANVQDTAETKDTAVATSSGTKDNTGKGFSAVLARRTHGSFHVPGTKGLGHGAGLAVTMRAVGLSPGHDCRTDSGCLSSLLPLSDS